MPQPARLTLLPILFLYSVAVAQPPAGSLYQQLIGPGIEFAPGVQYALPAASLISNESDEIQVANLERLAGNDGWTKFSRDSVVAPVAIDVAYLKDASGMRLGHQVHSAFVVHAKLDALRDKDLLQQIFGRSGDNDSSGTHFEALEASRLESHGILLDNDQVAYSRAEITLLDKIRVRGVIRTEKQSDQQGLTLAWQLEPAFDSDAELRATWSKIEKSNESESTNEPQPYRGWGGYLRVAEVRASPGLVLVESHMLMHEPSGWFSGSNFIRSKLPIAIQEGARNFRRKLAAAK